MFRRLGGAGPLIVAMVMAAHVHGQDKPGEPTLRVTRTPRPPVLDGRLDEDEWQLAEPVTGFMQRDPAEGEPASERTVVRLLYDEAYLYIGAELFDREPGAILATELRRDTELEGDDTFAILLDTFHDHRNAFLFRVNPNGAKYDAVIRNESRIDADWDEQWSVAPFVGPSGWTVEIAIPFKTLRFNRAPAHVWGINFERVIRRRNEAAYWTNWDRDFEFQQVSQAGVLTGLEDIRQGQRFRLRPYVVAQAESLEARTPPSPAGISADVGIDDLKIAVTSNLTADLAFNPDFAQTEIDEQRVNLTRFSLFFPEKRQFFLEGADSLRMSPPLDDFDDESLEIFHSRRIGLSDDGEPVPLIAGGKLTGKVGGVDLGVLSAWTNDAYGLPGEGFGVARFRRELLSRSYVGAIATVRQTDGTSRDTLGADARFALKEHLTVSALAARADGQEGPAQWARHLGAGWDDDLIDASLSYLWVDPRFDPALGFVRRQDRQLDARFSFDPRPASGPIRQFEFSPSATVNHDDAGRLVSRELQFGTEAGFQSGDEIEVSVEQTREVLAEPFEVSDGVVLPVGRYDWHDYEVNWQSFDGRRVSGEVSVEAGGFYSGTNLSLELSGAFRMGRHFTLRPDYELNDVSLDEGAFRTHLVGLRADVALDTDLLTSAFFQYNSEGALAALQVRLNYIFRDIDSFYLVYNETRYTAGDVSGRANRSLVAKLTYSLHW